MWNFFVGFYMMIQLKTRKNLKWPWETGHNFQETHTDKKSTPFTFLENYLIKSHWKQPSFSSIYFFSKTFLASGLKTTPSLWENGFLKGEKKDTFCLKSLLFFWDINWRWSPIGRRNILATFYCFFSFVVGANLFRAWSGLLLFARLPLFKYRFYRVKRKQTSNPMWFRV